MYAQLDSKRSFSQSDTKDDTRKALSPASSPISLHSKGESKEKNNELRESLIRDSAHRSPDSNMSRDTKSPRDGIEMNGVGRDSRGLRGVSNADDAHEDPFYVFKEDLLMKLELLDDTLLRYERVIQNTVSKSYCIRSTTIFDKIRFNMIITLFKTTVLRLMASFENVFY